MTLMVRQGAGAYLDVGIDELSAGQALGQEGCMHAADGGFYDRKGRSAILTR